MATIDTALVLGQSNAAGQGQPLWLLANQSHLLTLSSDHRIWNQQTQAIETIAPGTNCNTTTYGLNSPLHGPEVNLAYQWSLGTGNPIQIFKHAVVGTLGSNRQGTLPIWNKAANEIYPIMLAEVAAMTAAMALAGDTPSIEAVFWIQGESDALGALNSASYYNNLNQLLVDLRADLGLPLLPVYVVRLHDEFSATFQPLADTIRAAQYKSVEDAADPNYGLIDTDALTVSGDGIHFGDLGIHGLGQACYATSLLDPPGLGGSSAPTFNYDFVSVT